SGKVRIVWSPENKESFYDYSWLRFWGENRLNKQVGLPKQELWKNFSDKGLPKVTWSKENQNECLLKWLQHLKVFGLSLLKGVGSSPKGLEEILETFAIIKESNFGKIFDVKFEEEPISNAYTNIELPLHGDLCTRQFMPKYQFLHCLENSTEAGESLLADGFMLAKILKEKDPFAYNSLTKIDVHFINKAENSDYQWVEKVINLNKSGEVTEMRLSPWLRGPVCGNKEEEEHFYKAFRTFMKLAEDTDFQEKIKLEKGDILGFNNTRILHGRNAIGKGGKRWLRGCYMDGDDVDSTLRMGRIPRPL
ncbi:MAG: TauD/TfdA family dioxygenase, partial [Bdellovibrionota bacterium]|nr:TauD/TfdA family dioxygenase [Bdellovibrionota bacterium]